MVDFRQADFSWSVIEFSLFYYFPRELSCWNIPGLFTVDWLSLIDWVFQNTRMSHDKKELSHVYLPNTQSDTEEIKFTYRVSCAGLLSLINFCPWHLLIFSFHTFTYCARTGFFGLSRTLALCHHLHHRKITIIFCYFNYREGILRWRWVLRSPQKSWNN